MRLPSGAGLTDWPCQAAWAAALLCRTLLQAEVTSGKPHNKPCLNATASRLPRRPNPADCAAPAPLPHAPPTERLLGFQTQIAAHLHHPRKHNDRWNSCSDAGVRRAPCVLWTAITDYTSGAPHAHHARGGGAAAQCQAAAPCLPHAGCSRPARSGTADGWTEGACPAAGPLRTRQLA